MARRGFVQVAQGIQQGWGTTSAPDRSHTIVPVTPESTARAMTERKVEAVHLLTVPALRRSNDEYALRWKVAYHRRYGCAILLEDQHGILVRLLSVNF
jgi:hypothetical protein